MVQVPRRVFYQIDKTDDARDVAISGEGMQRVVLPAQELVLRPNKKYTTCRFVITGD